MACFLLSAFGAAKVTAKHLRGTHIISQTAMNIDTVESI